ncbi:MAG: ATPase, T2SS/T4P/T4SS family [Neisseriaceae bacterium]|jgi:Flp pilus assembly CpaF family ATPase
MKSSFIDATLAPIRGLLEDESINEIKTSYYKDNLALVWIYRHGCWETVLNKDGNLFVLEDKKIDQIITFMAGSNNQFAHAKSPIVEASIPYLGYRFTGVMMPASIGCSKFNIRKFSTKLFTFEEYVEQGMFEEEYIDVLRDWLKEEHFTICVAGSTNSGKTTFVCSLINEKRKLKPDDNWVVIEDTRELTIPAGNVDRLLTTREVSMDDHLKVTLRLTPDNCVVGEVRGKEASTVLELSKIKPVIFTMHAGKSYFQALSRFERMVLQHPDIAQVGRQDIADNINGIISLQNVRYQRYDDKGNLVYGLKRQITSIDQITGYDEEHNMYERILIK